MKTEKISKKGKRDIWLVQPPVVTYPDEIGVTLDDGDTPGYNARIHIHPWVRARSGGTTDRSVYIALGRLKKNGSAKSGEDNTYDSIILGLDDFVLGLKAVLEPLGYSIGTRQ